MVHMQFDFTTTEADLILKRRQFAAAMVKFRSDAWYQHFGLMVSATNVSLQAILLLRLFWSPLGFGFQVLALAVGYLAADFLNGLVHLVMDGYEDYTSLAGPLVANFHLHHRTPRYTPHHLAAIYFLESGSKIWLVVFLGLTLAFSGWLPAFALHLLVFTGVLSSVAEVSHYLCHTSNSRVAKVLAAGGLFLSKRHHAKHHQGDNTHYAFLNGFTDPLLNLIAKKYSRSYKRGTDQHYADFIDPSAESR